MDADVGLCLRLRQRRGIGVGLDLTPNGPLIRVSYQVLIAEDESI
jgi:hypothetical protein